MIFKEGWTTEEIQAKVVADKDATADEKILETEKSVVSNEAFLIAEMVERLINKLEHTRISGLLGRR